MIRFTYSLEYQPFPVSSLATLPGRHPLWLMIRALAAERDSQVWRVLRPYKSNFPCSVFAVLEDDFSFSMNEFCPDESMTVVTTMKPDRLRLRMIDMGEAYTIQNIEDLMKEFLLKHEKDTELIMFQSEGNNGDQVIGFINQRPGSKF